MEFSCGASLSNGPRVRSAWELLLGTCSKRSGIGQAGSGLGGAGAASPPLLALLLGVPGLAPALAWEPLTTLSSTGSTNTLRKPSQRSCCCPAALAGGEAVTSRCSHSCRATCAWCSSRSGLMRVLCFS